MSNIIENIAGLTQHPLPLFLLRFRGSFIRVQTNVLTTLSTKPIMIVSYNNGQNFEHNVLFNTPLLVNRVAARTRAVRELSLMGMAIVTQPIAPFHRS